MRSFPEIEKIRADARLTRVELCKRAGVNRDTWRRTAMGKTRPNVATLEKLSTALDALTAERRAKA